MSPKPIKDLNSTVATSRAIRMPETQYKTGLSKTHIYRLIRLDLFPKPFKLSERAIAFFEPDIDSWINQRRGEGIA
jgi:prophage regulatory protein